MYDDEELGNIFNLFDLTKSGFLSKANAIKALNSLANSQ